jgi:hypothetical protein
MAAPEKHYCSNCGRRVQAHQPKLTIKTRRSGNQVFHETWEGCYESTRDNGVYRTEAERNIQLLSWGTYI